MSDYADAVREMLEQDLACRCGAVNTPALRRIRVDINGVALCNDCGRGGDWQKFIRLPKDRSRT